MQLWALLSLCWPLAAGLNWAYDVDLDDAAGGSRSFRLHFADADCDVTALAASWLSAHVPSYAANDVEALRDAMALTASPHNVSKGNTRSCGWTSGVGNAPPGFDGAALVETHNLSYLNLGSGQGWWFTPREAGTDGWLHVDLHHPVTSAIGEAMWFDYGGAGAVQHIATLRANCTDGLAMFADGAFELVYSEHLFEHLAPKEAVTALREWYRLVQSGGLVRVSMPDLEKFLRGYSTEGRGFLEEHVGAYPEQFALPWEPTPSRATLVNDIFRNWDHTQGWLWDFAAFKQAAVVGAGIPEDCVVLSTYRDPALPPPLRNRDMAARRHESFYVNIHKR